ncbi:unnamed protein product [Calicophoron daubneyi]|uniref:Meckel syndrome type 1 protein n=1 Tax=Calicophoron daubneyi TaxID=300641 RepID=A0AAV2TD03_CALDB
MERSYTQKTQRLFTYVQGDEIPDIFKRPIEGGPKCYSYAFQKFQQLNEETNYTDIKKVSPFSGIVDVLTGRERHIAHFPSKPALAMYIMADLSDKSARTELNEGSCVRSCTDEVVLCIICTDGSNLLTVMPDFTCGSIPYTVESKLAKNVYHYVIEHVSACIPDIEKQKEARLMKQVIARKTGRTIAIIGNEFEMPQEQAFRLFVLGEIVSAGSFEYSKLFVQYYLDLPSSWRAYDRMLLCGSTQISEGKSPEKNEACLFGYPLEFDLAYKPGISTENEQPSALKWPMLFVEVISVDSWTRSRTEGYAYVEIPRTSGEHEIDLRCWRPAGDTVVENLRRFFVGGTCQLEDIIFSGIPGSFEGTHLVKYGFRTQSSGTVKLRFNCAVQSWSNLHKTVVSRPLRTTDDTKRMVLSHMDITTVIRAYQKARTRLLETRQVLEEFGNIHTE